MTGKDNTRAKSPVARMQVEMSYEKLEELELLMRECGFETKRELFNNAMTLLKWSVKHIKRGNSIASVNTKGGKYYELEMPFFSTIEQNDKAEIADDESNSLIKHSR